MIIVVLNKKSGEISLLANKCLSQAKLRYKILYVEKDYNELIQIFDNSFSKNCPTIIIQNKVTGLKRQLIGEKECVDWLRNIKYKNNF